MGKKKSNYEQAILSYYDAQVYGVYLPCPRCGKLRMKRRAITNAFSRYAPIYVCDTCGNEEAVEVARSGKKYDDNEVHVDKIADWFLFRNVYQFPEIQKSKREVQLTIPRTVTVSFENIDDIMSAALDGGITYWCKKAEVIEETYYGAYASEQIARGGSLRLYDAESSDVCELQDMIAAVTGTRPARKTVADDMTCIEAIYPLIVDTTSKEYTYHFSIEFLQEFFK